MLRLVFIWRPVATDDAVAGDDGLEDAAVVMGTVPMFWWQHNVTGLIANEIFVVWWNQQKLALSEASCPTIIREIKIPAFPRFLVDCVAQERNTLPTVIDIQS